MAIRKKPWKFWRKAASSDSPTNSVIDLIPKTPSPSSGQSDSTISPSTSSTSQNPASTTTLPFQQHAQTENWQSVSQTFTQDGQGQRSSGFFMGANRFKIKNPIMGEKQNIQLNLPQAPVQGTSQVTSSASQARARTDFLVLGENQEISFHNNHMKSNGLKEFVDYIIRGAQFNSADRDPPPRCHPGTRISIRDDLCTHIEAGTRIIWLHGPAGVGKSAIMQTLVETFVDSEGVFFGTSFLSRPNDRDDPRKVLPTLAYYLAAKNVEYRQYIEAKMEDDPICLAASLENQFRTLFVTPFVEKRVQFGSQPWIMFLDGLDECQNPEDSDNQSRIISLISDSIFHHAGSIPFAWVIASRPEENLKDAWLQIQERFRGRASDIWELAIPADSDNAARDVEHYLHKEFERIKKKNHRLIAKTQRWPSDGDFAKIAKESSGLFAFASTIVRYIDIDDENPIHRLRFIISLIDPTQRHLTTGKEKPFQAIDRLYSSIMSTIPGHLLSFVKPLLGFYFLLNKVVDWQGVGSSKVALIEACNILGLEQSEAYTALRKLSSVLICPSPEAAQDNGIEFFHASFSDFLCDHSRSQEYYIDLDQELTNVWRRFTKILKSSRAAQGPAGVNISWAPDNGASLDKLQEKLLQMAQYNWIRIVINNSFSETRTRCLQVDAEGLVEGFQSLGLSFLSGNKFPVGPFLDWLDKCASGTVRERVISQRFPLSQLEVERLFRSLCFSPRYRYATTSDVYEINLRSIKDLEGSQWTQAKAVLWTPEGEFHRLVKSSNEESVRVTIVGIEPTESCAIIGPIKLGTSDERFFILPYSLT